MKDAMMIIRYYWEAADWIGFLSFAAHFELDVCPVHQAPKLPPADRTGFCVEALASGLRSGLETVVGFDRDVQSTATTLL